MAINPIQFQAGLSLTELFDSYGTEEQCEEALEHARWPNGFECDHYKGIRASTFQAVSKVMVSSIVSNESVEE